MEDDESDVNDVFGITTVVNITNKKHVECVQQLRQLLTDLAEEHADDRIKAFVQKLLSNDSQNVGLLINERFVNIPPQISVPLLQGLNKEIQSARDKKMPYDFQYYILISKLYKTDPTTTSKKKKNKQTGQPEPDILFSNAEEEVFDEESDLKFEFSVKNESDSGMVGGWMEDDATMTPYRRVLIISASKMDTIISKINAFVN
uniref:Protein BCCIP homolog n=1 Tax=Cacopsylla melanoneura TaxID=428564 RepID=A0A8D8RH50_9HEMI